MRSERQAAARPAAAWEAHPAGLAQLREWACGEISGDLRHHHLPGDQQRARPMPAERAGEADEPDRRFRRPVAALTGRAGPDAVQRHGAKVESDGESLVADSWSRLSAGSTCRHRSRSPGRSSSSCSGWPTRADARAQGRGHQLAASSALPIGDQPLISTAFSLVPNQKDPQARAGGEPGGAVDKISAASKLPARRPSPAPQEVDWSWLMLSLSDRRRRRETINKYLGPGYTVRPIWPCPRPANEDGRSIPSMISRCSGGRARARSMCAPSPRR